MKNVFLPPLGNNLIHFNTIPSSGFWDARWKTTMAEIR
jgi:hypothetical protein